MNSNRGMPRNDKSSSRNVGFVPVFTTDSNIQSKLCIETGTDANCSPNSVLHFCHYYNFVCVTHTARNHFRTSRRVFEFPRVLEWKCHLVDGHSGPRVQTQSFRINPS